MNKALFCLLWLVPALLPAQKPASASATPAKKERFLAIVGADIYPVSGPVIHGGTVLIAGSRIFKVGPSVAIPKGARVVEARGRFVCPGFVAAQASGVFGGARARGKDKLKDALDPFNTTMLMALASGITTAHVGALSQNPFASFFGRRGGGMGGTPTGQEAGTVGKLCFGTLKGFELKAPAGVYFTYAQNRAADQARTRAVLKDVQSYLHARAAWLDQLAHGKKDAKAPALKRRLAPWVKVYDRELPAFTHANTRRQIEAVLNLSERFDLPLVITGGEESWTLPSAIGRGQVGVLVNTRGEGFDHYRYRTRPGKRRFQQGPGGWSLETAKLLWKAGVPWASVTQNTGLDLIGIPGKDITSLSMAAALAVRGGVSNQEALRSITLTPARLLKVADRVGSLEEGKDADILLLDRPPLDYRALVLKAWVNGRLAYDKERIALWSHVQTDRSKGFKKGWKRFGIWREYPDGIGGLESARSSAPASKAGSR